MAAKALFGMFAVDGRISAASASVALRAGGAASSRVEAGRASLTEAEFVALCADSGMPAEGKARKEAKRSARDAHARLRPQRTAKRAVYGRQNRAYVLYEAGPFRADASSRARARSGTALDVAAVESAPRGRMAGKKSGGRNGRK